MADKDDKDGEDKLDFKALNAALGALPKSVQDAVKDGLKPILEAQEKAKPKVEEEDPDDDADVEKMSRTEFLDLIERKFGKALKASLEPITKGLDSTKESIERDKLVKAFGEIRGKNKDFDEWKEEITAIASESPNLSPARMYNLARSENPEKAAKMDEKYKDTTEDDKVVAFGGLTPTSGKGGNDEKTGKLDSKDAASKAWEQTMENVPAKLIGDSN